MRKIAIINQKGGVGKTTTAVNLSAALAAAGKSVCLLDLDPQAHASLHLGVVAGEGEKTIYHVLTGSAHLSEARRPVADRLSLVPAHLDLAAAELELAAEVGRDCILRDYLKSDGLKSDGLKTDGADFDFLIIDCAPSLGVLTLNALTAVDEVFLPLQPHFLALHGLSKLLRTVAAVSDRLNDGLRLTGVLLCLYESGTRLAAEVSSDVDDFFRHQAKTHRAWSDARPFETKIRRNIRLAEAPSYGQSIFEYAPNSAGAEDYGRLAREVLGLPLEAVRESVSNAAA